MQESWSRDLIETQHFALKCKHSHVKPDNCKSILRLYGDCDCTKHNLYCLWQCKCSQVVFTGIKLGKVVTLAIRIQKQLDNIRYDALYFFIFRNVWLKIVPEERMRQKDQNTVTTFTTFSKNKIREKSHLD